MRVRRSLPVDLDRSGLVVPRLPSEASIIKVVFVDDKAPQADDDSEKDS